HPAGHGHRLKRVLAPAVAADDRPSRRFAERRAEDDVAQKVAIVDEPGGGEIAGGYERRPRRAISKVTLEHRRRREGGGRVTGREGTTLARWTIALRRVFHSLHQHLRDDLRTQQVEPEMGRLVGAGSVRPRWHEVTPYQPEPDRRPDFNLGTAHPLAELEHIGGGTVAHDVPLDVIISGMCRKRPGTAGGQQHPRGTALRKREEVPAGVLDQGSPARVGWFGVDIDGLRSLRATR